MIDGQAQPCILVLWEVAQASDLMISINGEISVEIRVAGTLNYWIFELTLVHLSEVNPESIDLYSFVGKHTVSPPSN